MSAVARRAARREQEAANLLRTERVKHRPRFASMPDMKPIRLKDGNVLVCDAKTRRKLARWIVDGLAQARRYHPNGVPMLAISELRGEAIALLRLRDLCMLLGIGGDDGAGCGQLSFLGRP